MKKDQNINPFVQTIQEQGYDQIIVEQGPTKAMEYSLSRLEPILNNLKNAFDQSKISYQITRKPASVSSGNPNNEIGWRQFSYDLVISWDRNPKVGEDNYIYSHSLMIRCTSLLESQAKGKYKMKNRFGLHVSVGREHFGPAVWIDDPDWENQLTENIKKALKYQ